MYSVTKNNQYDICGNFFISNEIGCQHLPVRVGAVFSGKYTDSIGGFFVFLQI